MGVIAALARFPANTSLKERHERKIDMIQSILKTIVILISLFIPFNTLAQEQPLRAFDIDTIEQLGKAIFEQDTYAAKATDLLFAQQLDLQHIPIRGWIVEKQQGNIRVIFIQEEAGTYEGIFEIVFQNPDKGEFKKVEQPTLTESQLAQFKARQLALKHIREGCSNRYNVVVLPDIDGQGWLVYGLAATIDPKIILVGGHYRFIISADGETIEQKDKLFKSCLALEKTPDELSPSQEPVGYFMSHIVSDTPVETHVFLTLLHKQPFFVITRNEERWKIDNGHMTIIKEGEQDF
jgi:hypothetical protein